MPASLFLNHFIIFIIYKTTHCLSSLPSLESVISPRRPGPFEWGMGNDSRNQDRSLLHRQGSRNSEMLRNCPNPMVVESGIEPRQFDSNICALSTPLFFLSEPRADNSQTPQLQRSRLLPLPTGPLSFTVHGGNGQNTWSAHWPL